MKTLREQIKESFFNPMLYLLPLLMYIVIDDLWGKERALTISLPTAFLLVIYVYFRYEKVTVWYLFFATAFMSIGIIANLISLFPIPDFLHKIEVKIIVLVFVVGLLFFRRTIRRVFKRTMPQILPITNNLNELYLVAWALCYILLSYVILYLLVRYLTHRNTALYLQLLQNIFIAVITFLASYEILRIHIIRAKLLREEWWPIVNKNGKVIGNIQSMTSLIDDKKYLHPIVRVVLVHNGMIFLQKRASSDLLFPDLWDTAISNHVRMSENIDQCIDRTVKERYFVSGMKSMFLSNYIAETDKEYHYAFLFVSCLQEEVIPNKAYIQQTKWWTKQQIEDNLESGIFTSNFRTEYELIKRSGLLQTVRCSCECKLRDEVFHSK